MSAIEIFSVADVADFLGVTRAAVSNWFARLSDTPTPFAISTDGRQFWDRAGMQAWLQWHNARGGVDRRSRMDSLRAELTQP